MDWMKILSAVFFIMMIVYLLPRVRQMVKDSPKGSNADWMGFVIPVGAVIGFVVLLMLMV
tara:strand:+ start:497 stop:676 length:180 start_codon:yes stop_codon:yes gene_type:complete